MPFCKMKAVSFIYIVSHTPGTIIIFIPSASVFALGPGGGCGGPGGAAWVIGPSELEGILGACGDMSGAGWPCSFACRMRSWMYCSYSCWACAGRRIGPPIGPVGWGGRGCCYKDFSVLDNLISKISHSKGKPCT